MEGEKPPRKKVTPRIEHLSKGEIVDGCIRAAVFHFADRKNRTKEQICERLDICRATFHNFGGIGTIGI